MFFRFPQFYLYSCVCVCAWSPIPFYLQGRCVCAFTHSLPKSRGHLVGHSLAPLSVPWPPWVCPPFPEFCHSNGTMQMESHSTWPSQMAFFTDYSSLERDPWRTHGVDSSFLCIAVVFHGMSATIHVIVHRLKYIRINSNFCLLWIKLLWTSM